MTLGHHTLLAGAAGLVRTLGYAGTEVDVPVETGMIAV